MINNAFFNNYGQNWKASLIAGGTPGAQNSVADLDLSPIVLNVKHSPALPWSDEPVTVTAKVLDELPTGNEVALLFRADGTTLFNRLAMVDDGKHGDGGAADAVYGAEISPQPKGNY